MVCSDHFSAECFERSYHMKGTTRRLKQGSVPSIWKKTTGCSRIHFSFFPSSYSNILLRHCCISIQQRHSSGFTSKSKPQLPHSHLRNSHTTIVKTVKITVTSTLALKRCCKLFSSPSWATVSSYSTISSAEAMGSMLSSYGRNGNRSFRQRVVSPTVSSPTSRVDSPTFLCHILGQFANVFNRSYNMFADNLIPVWSVYRCKSVNIPFEHILRIYIFLTRTYWFLFFNNFGNTLGMNFRYIHLKRKHHFWCFCESHFKFITTVFPKI